MKYCYPWIASGLPHTPDMWSQVMDAREELREGVRWAETSLDFDVDARVHVFELTIRALGGLLSTHSLLVRDSSLVPGERPSNRKGI